MMELVTEQMPMVPTASCACGVHPAISSSASKLHHLPQWRHGEEGMGRLCEELLQLPRTGGYAMQRARSGTLPTGSPCRPHLCALLEHRHCTFPSLPSPSWRAGIAHPISNFALATAHSLAANHDAARQRKGQIVSPALQRLPAPATPHRIRAPPVPAVHRWAVMG